MEASVFLGLEESLEIQAYLAHRDHLATQALLDQWGHREERVPLGRTADQAKMASQGTVEARENKDPEDLVGHLGCRDFPERLVSPGRRVNQESLDHGVRGEIPVTTVAPATPEVRESPETMVMQGQRETQGDQDLVDLEGKPEHQGNQASREHKEGRGHQEERVDQASQDLRETLEPKENLVAEESVEALDFPDRVARRETEEMQDLRVILAMLAQEDLLVDLEKTALLADQEIEDPKEDLV